MPQHGQGSQGGVLDAVSAALALDPSTNLGQSQSSIAVAYSGGLDSTVLLHALRQLIDPSRIVALHVHHGLQASARHWPEVCAEQAAQWGVRFERLDLDDAPTAGDSIEQWASQARYRVLSGACHKQNIMRLWTAHHADDQIETVFLRLGRGAGLSGLRSIAARRERDGVLIERPLLALSRHHLADHASRHALRWIDDPSNTDQRFARNALRHSVLPAFDRAMPGFRQVIARNLAHWQAAADTLEELADADLTGAEGIRLDRASLQGLTPARRAWALRAWLARLGLRAPQSARFDQMLRQLVLAESPHARVDHDGVAFLRYRDQVTAVPLAAVKQLEAEAPPVLLSDLTGWQGGESSTTAVDSGAGSGTCLDTRLGPSSGAGRRIALGAGRGWLGIEPVDPTGTASAQGQPAAFRRPVATGQPAAPGQGASLSMGVDAGWLGAPDARIVTGSQGAFRLRLRANGPSRPLRHLYQQFGVPPWLRLVMPVVLVGDEVLFSGAFGLDRSARWQLPPNGATIVTESVRLTWEPDPRWLEPLGACGHPWGANV